MKRIQKHYILFLFLAGLIFGCEPDMELTDPSSLSTGSYYKSEQELVAAVNGAYNMLQRNGGWGRYMFYTINSKGEDWNFTAKASAGMKEIPPICNYTYSSTNLAVNECWDDMYAMMYAANLAIEKLKESQIDDSLKSRLLGESYFLRGLSLFYLGQLFGEEIPVNGNTPTDKDDLYAPSAKPGVLYETMIGDFKEAVDLLPVRSVMYENDDDVGRATKGSAMGYLAKAYMNRPTFDQQSANNTSEWELARDVLYQIIESEEYQLTQVFRENHTIVKENNIESLFEIQFSNGTGGFNSAIGEDYIASWGQSDQSTWRQQEIGQKDGGDNSNWWNMMPTAITFNEFERAGDTITDPRAYQTLWCPSGAKYRLTSGRWVTFDRLFYKGTGDVNWGSQFGCRKNCGDEATSEWETGINDRVLRYSDILLMYAECLVETGAENEAYPYINQVRERANHLVDSTTSNQDLFYINYEGGLPTVENLIASAPTINGVQINTIRRAIKHERFVELFGEGHHFLDLMRWSYNNNDPDQATVLNPIKDKYGPGVGFVRGVHEYFPIPSAELLTNPNIKQNRAN